MERDVVISLGAGVQSTTLLAMAAAGEIGPMPTLAIFADTGGEPAHVYEHLDFLERSLGERIEIVRVSAGNLREDIQALGTGARKRLSNPPLFSLNDRGERGMLPRGCTRDYKIRPLERELRRRGYGKDRPIEQWLGISYDEIQRMKPTAFPGATTRWPLIEERMTRADCKRWLAEHGYPEPPKSACTFCPYHSDAAWRQMRDEQPDEFADAIVVDSLLRIVPGGHGETFLHRDRVPLWQVDLRSLEDRGQMSLDLDDGAADECGGNCFV